MTSFRLFLVSTAPCLVWAFVGCGSGGGFRGATLTHDDGGSDSVSGAGGSTNGGAGAGGANGGDAGAGGLTTDAGAGMGGENVGAGQAGVAGSVAGSLGTGGTAGEASGGVSGSSIVAGGDAGGEAGSGTTSGGAGAGGIAGGGGTAGTAMAGGGGMSGGGSGGMAGGSGSGGSAGSGGPLGICAERCSADVDCRIFGVDQGYRCNPSTHRCEAFAEPCRSSLECLPEASFWIFDCTTDADCFFFSDDLCVEVAGVGRCARLAPSPNGCDEPNADEVTLPRFGRTDGALVCANASRTCFEGACVPGCRSNTDCVPARNGSICDVDSRLCRCVRDEDCGGLGVSHCNTATGRCECADSRDCEEVPNSNTCNAGRCGCSAVSACNVERKFSGTSYVCE